GGPPHLPIASRWAPSSPRAMTRAERSLGRVEQLAAYVMCTIAWSSCLTHDDASVRSTAIFGDVSYAGDQPYCLVPQGYDRLAARHTQPSGNSLRGSADRRRRR